MARPASRGMTGYLTLVNNPIKITTYNYGDLFKWSDKLKLLTPATLTLEDKSYSLPTYSGVEGEKAIDITKLRSQTGYVTLDDGYGNTGACESAITYIDGEKGILRYRGYPIEELAEHSRFVEVALSRPLW